MSDETKVMENEAYGKKMFSVFEVDDKGEKAKDFPVVSFGIKKAKAVLKHIEDLKGFVNDHV